MNPLVTLAIPVYNVELYVERALRSALDQTYSNLEILIIDDRGTDNSMDIVEHIVSTHRRKVQVRIITHEKNRGTGATKNTSIDNANGEYIYFMDSDDSIAPNTIEYMVGKLNESNGEVDFVSGSCSVIDASGKRDINRYGYDTDSFLSGDFCAFKYEISSKNQISVPAWNKLYRLSFLKDNSIKCIPRQLNEDAWFTFQVILSAKSALLCSEPTYNYYIREGSTTDLKGASTSRREFLTNQYVEICNLKRDYIKKFRNSCLYADILEYVMNDCIGHSVTVMMINTLYLLNKYRLKIQGGLAVITELYTNKKISNAISKMLIYPENAEFLNGLQDSKKVKHQKFYKIGNSGKLYKLSYLIYGWLVKHSIKNR